MALFCAYLVEQGHQSSTICSYISAIKNVLCTDGYQWNHAVFQMDTVAAYDEVWILGDRFLTRSATIMERFFKLSSGMVPVDPVSYIAMNYDMRIYAGNNLGNRSWVALEIRWPMV